MPKWYCFISYNLIPKIRVILRLHAIGFSCWWAECKMWKNENIESVNGQNKNRHVFLKQHHGINRVISDFILIWNLFNRHIDKTHSFNLFHYLSSKLMSEFCFIQVFPKFGISARIVLERNKVTSNRDLTCDPRTIVLTSCVHSLMPCQLSYLGKC